MITGNFISFILNMFLFPLEAINLGIDWLLGIDWVVDIIKVVAYVLPWFNILPLLTIIIAIYGFRIIVATIKFIYSLIPFV